MFKRIYVEITNACNLNCFFCTQDNLAKRHMKLSEFQIVLNNIKNYTREIYLHVKGEPLLCNEIDQFIAKAHDEKINVNITTNGRLLLQKYDKLIQKQVKRFNVSMHSFYPLDKEELYRMLNDLYLFITKYHQIYPNTFFSLRLWANTNKKISQNNDQIVSYLQKIFNCDKIINNRLKNYVILSHDEEFVWPSLDSSFYETIGSCRGGRDQLAILVDGTVCICCLDSKGTSNLGNIYKESLKEILSKPKYIEAVKGFQNNKLQLSICRHCSYRKRFE